MPKRTRPADRGFTLIAVLVIVGSALLVATSMVFIAQAEIAGASYTARTAQTRSSVESALQVVVLRLNEQRDVILDGELPVLDEQYELYEHGSTLGVARLLPVTPDNRRLEPQAAKLDLNAEGLTVEMLVATGMIDDEQAEAILNYRQRAPGQTIHSIAELLNVNGISAEMLYGPVEDLLDDDTDFSEGDLAQRVGARFASDEPRGLADILTVFSVEPELQRDGRRRINLNVDWSSELGRRLADRFGQEVADVLQNIMSDGGIEFEDLSMIFQVMASFGVEPDDWPEALDALTVTDETYTFGRVDLNTASETVLLALPTITPEQAAEIVRSRDSLTADDRATIAWPAIAGIIEPSAYPELGRWMTTRSWTYRLRVAVGEVDADDPDGPLADPAVFEMVVDLAAPHPRIAYLRNTSMLRSAAMLSSLDVGGNSLARDWYEEEETWVEPTLEEDAAQFDWPDEEESWPSDDLADEREEIAPTDAPAVRQRLGRWRSGPRSP